MTVFTRIFNVTVALGAVLSLAGCPSEEPDPEPLCQPGAQRPADDGCNTCICDDSGQGWACTEIACEPECGAEEILVDGVCQPICYGDDGCGEGQRCNAEELCLSPAGDGENGAAVCVGYCVPDGVDCPAIGCAIDCEFGYRTDANGCDLCECLPPPMCEEVACDLFCENGYRTDENGCDICACNEPECPDVACDLDCEYGYATDVNGCGICECLPPPMCEGDMCEMFCEYGFQTDENGCEICACNEAPVCEPVLCDLYCEFGFQTNEDGCEVCACNEAPVCEPVECEMECEFGFQTGEDGCEICACNEAPPVCEPVLCEIACEHGFQTDANGCEICACAEGPACEADEVAANGMCYQGCYGDQDCGAGQTCNAPWLCLSPPGGEEGGDLPAVCYGYCEEGQIDG